MDERQGRLASFEGLYVEVRTREGRHLTIEQIRQLPEPPDSSLKTEWRARAWSVGLVERYLAPRRPRAILDLGCGTGWLSARLRTRLGATVVGLDALESELALARAAFDGDPELRFVRGDVFDPDLLGRATFDAIIAAGVAPYFADLRRLIERALELLAPAGVAIVMESPIWFPADVAGARARTERHYASLGVPDMARRFHHHSRDDVASFAPEWLHDPTWTRSRLLRKTGLGAPTPFPILAFHRAG